LLVRRKNQIDRERRLKGQGQGQDQKRFLTANYANYANYATRKFQEQNMEWSAPILKLHTVH
jgi:hypothetical protein